MPFPPEPSVAPPLFYWCHTTLRQRFETGIQRVTRRLGGGLVGLGIDVVPVGWDERTRLIGVIGEAAGGPRGFEARLGSSKGACLLVPELTADLVAAGIDPLQLGRAYGLRTVAFVHDLIPLKLVGDYGPDAGIMFRRYYDSVGAADRIITTTDYVAGDLRRYLEGRGIETPSLAVIPLPAQFGDLPRAMPRRRDRQAAAPLTLVAVSSWEPRKNLLRLLSGLRIAQGATATPIALTLVGHRGLFPSFDEEMQAMLATSADVTVAGRLPDTALAGLVTDSDATIYASLEEGFGLPVGESLWLGTPCLCHDGSSIAEIAPGGGTLMVDMADEQAIAAALLSLVGDPAVLPRLAQEIARRPLADWRSYAAAVAATLR